MDKAKDAIAHRDLDFVLASFFVGKPPALRDAKRKAMVAIRQGKRDVDTMLVDAAKEIRREGKLDEAEDLLITAVQRNPSSWRAARELGDFYKHEKKTSLALDYYVKATSLAPRKGKDRALIFREFGILLQDAADQWRLSQSKIQTSKSQISMPISTYWELVGATGTKKM